MNRFGNGLLALLGLALVALMVYSMAPDLWGPHRSSRDAAARVAVFFPDREYWSEFRRGVDACVSRGLATKLEDGADFVVLATKSHRRSISFALHDVRGKRETKDEVEKLVLEANPPVAVVGSSNTVLTTALAEAVWDVARAEGRPIPVLLVPWATAVLTEPLESFDGTRSEPTDHAQPVSLLEIDRGRTFRFCPNNQEQADLLVRCVAEQEPGVTPGRVDLVVDRNDPYSLDLADSFHRVIERRFKNVDLIEHADKRGYPNVANVAGLPSTSEDSLAESLCRSAAQLGPGQVAWVVLPLQEAPARRMLLALRRHARQPDRSESVPLRVLCGDAVGLKVFEEMARDCPFELWGFSPNSLRAGNEARDTVRGTNVQVAAEIVSATLYCLDVPDGKPATADALRESLAGLRLGPDDPFTFGRSLAFAPSGERQGSDLGHVLHVRPGDSSVWALERLASSRWSAPVSISSAPVAAGP